jgi:hypothetical protein
MNRDTVLLLAGAGGFALGVMFALGLAVSVYVKHRGSADSSSDA